MTRGRIHILWLILPAAVFVLLVAAFLTRLGPPPQVMVEATPSPVPATETFAPAPVAEDGLTSLVSQIRGWQVDDPRLVPPSFDRKISLGAE